jgi:alpha-tubulin suppressor-like RCC1 family protein
VRFWQHEDTFGYFFQDFDLYYKQLMDVRRHTMKRLIILGAVIIAALFAGCESPTNPRDEAVSAVTAGYAHTMFLKSDGTLWGMGLNVYGQLGIGDTISRVWTPVMVISGVSVVSAGYYHTMILKSDGTLWATGYNPNGMLGVGDTATFVRSPIQVIGGSGVSAVSAGAMYTMFIKGDHTLWAVGDNYYGQLGDGTRTLKSAPVFIRSGVSAVSAGQMHTMIIANDTLYGSGYNYYGQLGQGDTLNDSTFTKVYGTNGTGVSAVAVGTYHTMFIRNNGSLWAAGRNRYGEHGTGDTATRVRYPASVMTEVSAVSAGNYLTMIIRYDGSLRMAGYNNFGQLGTGDMIDRWTPFQVMSPVSAVSAGYAHSMILRGDGTLFGTGNNELGQLGTGDTTGTDVTMPARVWPKL